MLFMRMIMMTSAADTVGQSKVAARFDSFWYWIWRNKEYYLLGNIYTLLIYSKFGQTYLERSDIVWYLSHFVVTSALITSDNIIASYNLLFLFQIFHIYLQVAQLAAVRQRNALMLFWSAWKCFKIFQK